MEECELCDEWKRTVVLEMTHLFGNIIFSSYNITMGKRKYTKNSNFNKRLKKLETEQERDNKTIEYKQVYYVEDGIQTYQAWNIRQNILPTLLQGTEDGGNTVAPFVANARIGNNITIVSLTITFECSISAHYPNGVGCRFIIVDNKQGSLALPASKCLQNDSTNYSMVSSFKTNPSFGETYNKLMDKRFTLNTYDNPIQRWTWKMKLPKSGKVISFPDNSSSLPVDFNMSINAFSDFDLLGVPADRPKYKMFCKLKYIDA